MCVVGLEEAKSGQKLLNKQMKSEFKGGSYND